MGEKVVTIVKSAIFTSFSKPTDSSTIRLLPILMTKSRPIGFGVGKAMDNGLSNRVGEAKIRSHPLAVLWGGTTTFLKNLPKEENRDYSTHSVPSPYASRAPPKSTRKCNG